jgi:hypothetical protein
LLFVTSLLLWGPDTASAEFVCKSEVKYHWKKVDGEEEESKPNEVIFALLEARGEAEAEAKAKVEEQVLRHSARATAHCSKQHENLSGCIATKFSAQQAVLDRLGFSARKKLEEAITLDCQTRMGVCQKVEASEVKCTEVSTEEGGEKEKEKKK